MSSIRAANAGEIDRDGRQLGPDVSIAAVLLLLAAATRFYGLGRWDIVLDEIFTVNEAADRLASLVNPLYYWLVVFAQRLIDQPELAARVPSAVMGTLAVPVLYWTWSKVTGRYAAAVGAILILLAEWNLWHSQYARFFQGTFLFGSLAYYWYLRGIVAASWRQLALSHAAGIIAAGFHIAAGTVIAGCAAMSLLIALRPLGGIDDAGRRLAKLHFAACVATALLAAPLVWQVVGDRAAAALTWSRGPFRMLLGVVDEAEIAVVFAALAGWLLVATTDRLLAIHSAVCIAVALGALLAGAAIGAAVRVDYVYHVMPFTYLLAGCFAARVAVGLRPAGVLRHSLAVVLVATLLPGTVSHYLGRMTLHARDVAAFIERNYQPGDRIIGFDAGVRFYLDPLLETEPYPGNPHSDRNVDDRLQRYLCSDERTWIALRTRRESYTPELERWLLRHAQLVWRDSAERFDLHPRGFEVFLVPRGAGCD